MTEQDHIHFEKIAEAIAFIKTHFKEQPSLNEIAEAAHLSPFHFQRLFTEWAGVSPKKFTQYLSLNYAKQLLKERQATLFDVACETGLSGTGRLHDLFLTIEGMTPGEFRNGGKNLRIHYSIAGSPFGEMIVASTSKGICHIAFITTREQAVSDMKLHFPNAEFLEQRKPVHEDVLCVFQRDWSNLNPVRLHVYGTPFQLKVWEALLQIPMGNLTTYGDIAAKIDKPGASRAVGTAIGSNPVAFLIPCHRVIQSSGNSGGYMWGSVRKSAMIGWEAARTQE